MRAFDGLDLVLALACFTLLCVLLVRGRQGRGVHLDPDRVIHDHWND